MTTTAKALFPTTTMPVLLLRRLNEVIAGSALLAFIAVAGIGAAMADQAGRQAMRLLGDQSFIGVEYPVLGLQEFCPLVVALVLALRVGAGFTAELATLRSDDTFDALLVAGAKPWQRRVWPMVLALPPGALALTVLSLVAWETAGVAVMLLRSGVNPFTFIHPEVVTPPLLALLVVKSLVFGACIAAGAVFAAMAPNRPGELGVIVTRGVVTGTLLTLACNLVLDVAWYLA